MKQLNNENQHLPKKPVNSSFADVNYLSLDRIVLPPTLSSDDSVEVLSFPTRLENALKSTNVITVGDFCSISEEKLKKTRNIGPRTMKYFREVKREVADRFCSLENADHTAEAIISQSEDTLSPDSLVAFLLDRCGSDKARQIVQRRYGLTTGERQTLEEIGEDYGVTRERIRQIQAKALGRMKHPVTKARKPLTLLIEELLFDNGGILTDEEADTKVPEVLKESSEDGSSLLDLMCDLGWIQSCRTGDLVVYSPLMNGVSLCRLSNDVTSLIRKEDLGLSAEEITKKVKRLKLIKESRFDAKTFVLRYCRIDPRIEEVPTEQAESTFRHYTSGNFATKAWVALLTKILEMEQSPLHFTEISNKLNDLVSRMDRYLDVRRVHSILIESEVFAHSGVRGTYGLTSWGFRRETTPQLIEECLRKAGFPLHWKQISNYVSKYKDSKPGNITAALDNNARFKRVDYGVYWLKEG